MDAPTPISVEDMNLSEKDKNFIKKEYYILLKHLNHFI